MDAVVGTMASRQQSIHQRWCVDGGVSAVVSAAMEPVAGLQPSSLPPAAQRLQAITRNFSTARVKRACFSFDLKLHRGL